MAEMLEDTQGLESTTVNLWRNAKVVKGGRRFSLSALVVVGDRNGRVGIGYGKATGAPLAIEKAQKAAKKNMVRVSLKDGTIPHQVTGKYCASSVRLVPAAPGTGVIAGGTVRAILEMAGVRDCLSRAYGSTNQKNLVKATLEGLQQLRTKESIASLRGVEIQSSTVEELLDAGRRWTTVSRSTEKAQGPVNKVGQKTGGRGRSGGGRSRGRRSDGQQEAAAASPQTPAAPETSEPPQA